MLILGIETSCDETGIAVVKNGREVLADSLMSQIDLHAEYGGVVPELAARKHSENLDYVLDDALRQAEVQLSELDAIAVTYGPGLPGALLVGIAFAKGLAYSLNIPLIPVDHIEAHLESVRITEKDKDIYPAVGLVVSGGHTILFHIKEPGEYRLIGKTRDDAAGEAFDKVAKMLDLGYPGGPVIDKLYHKGNPGRFKFKPPRFSDDSADFSFSGFKTAVLKVLKDTPDAEKDDKFIFDLAASFQAAVVNFLIDRIASALEKMRPDSIVISGGVAVNSLLRKHAAELGERYNIPVFIPAARYCTDNGVMIAALGSRLLEEGITAGLDLDAIPDLKLGE